MTAAVTPGKGGSGFMGHRGAVWRVLASWLVPVIMAIAYGFMALTAETDTTGKAWMALGFVFVLVVWWIFRIATTTAALARAVSVGDSDRILELVPASATSPLARVQRAFAYEMRGAWADAIAETTAAMALPGLPAGVRGGAAAIRVGALVEAGRTAEARALWDAELAQAEAQRGDHELARQGLLARGRVLWAEGDRDGARAAVEKVIRDIRSGSAHRAIAHVVAARIATADGDAAAAAKHRTEAARLAPTSWLSHH